VSRTLTYDSDCRTACNRPLDSIEPNDCTGRTTFNRASHIVILLVIHNGQVSDHRNYIVRRIDRAFAAGITSDLTILDRRISLLQVLAGNPQAVTNRV